MTLIISWIGVDCKKEGNSVSSLYIGTDSRYSWGSQDTFDMGQKVFGCSNFPEIFGFCGDVLFPILILHQLISQIDSGVLFSESENLENKNRKVFDYIKNAWSKYPKDQSLGEFTIIHGTRKDKEFACYKMNFSKGKPPTPNIIPLAKVSKVIYYGGSGENEFKAKWKEWNYPRHNEFRTSRGVYHCLEETLRGIKDSRTGGLPQVVGLYRNKNAKLFGIISNGKRYIYGDEISDDIDPSKIDWRNEDFERINPKTLELLEGAQKQPRVKKQLPGSPL